MTRYTGPGGTSRWSRSIPLLLATTGLIAVGTYFYGHKSPKSSRQNDHQNILDISYTTLKCPDAEKRTGEFSDFCQGKVCLVVNVACEWGLTVSNYAQLNALSKKYKDLVVIAQPSNEFGKQEPDSGEKLCTRIKTEFLQPEPSKDIILLEKAKVNGPDATELFSYLTDVLPGWWNKKIKWNFTKFLVDRNGVPFKRYGPKDAPDSFEDDIIKLINRE